MNQKTNQARAAQMIQLRNNFEKNKASAFFPPKLFVAIQEGTDDNDDMTQEKVLADVASLMLKAVSQPMTMEKNEEKMTSEETYTAFLLDLYDLFVWGFNSPFLWRIQEDEIHRLYRANISPNHCEIAVGTGLFLASISISNVVKKMTLVDLNENSLESCEARTRRHNYSNLDEGGEKNPAISKIVADIATPTGDESELTPIEGNFQSVGANFLFHCIHGSNLYDKIDAFRNCASLLDPKDGVFFGSTILGKEIIEDAENAGKTTMHVLNAFNDVGVFGNTGDYYDELESILNSLFHDVELKRVGYCGVWRASRTKRQVV